MTDTTTPQVDRLYVTLTPVGDLEPISAIQYDGTNHAAIAALAGSGWLVTSDAEGPANELFLSLDTDDAGQVIDKPWKFRSIIAGDDDGSEGLVRIGEWVVSLDVDLGDDDDLDDYYFNHLELKRLLVEVEQAEPLYVHRWEHGIYNPDTGVVYTAGPSQWTAPENPGVTDVCRADLGDGLMSKWMPSTDWAQAF